MTLWIDSTKVSGSDSWELSMRRDGPFGAVFTDVIAGLFGAAFLRSSGCQPLPLSTPFLIMELSISGIDANALLC